MLAESTFEPISKLARKLKGEIKYHVMHADIWINQLGNAGKESNSRLQKTLYESFNLALGIFENSEYEDILISSKVFPGEEKLEELWLKKIIPIIESASLKLPDKKTWKPAYGGRNGKHTEYLQPLIDEMSEVFRIDPKAEW